MTSIANIVDAIRNPFCVWRTLNNIEPLRTDGEPRYVVGNAAVTFFVEHNHKPMILKCYTRTHKNLATIYGNDFHPRELCVADLSGRKLWIDCLLTPLIEGSTLDALLRTTDSPQILAKLASTFDNMACELLLSARAHGDLKPENIIVAPDYGSMTAIDWDAAYLPQFRGEESPEIGTAAYQHPARTKEMFDKHIDDYSIAAISTLLHSAAISADTLQYYRSCFEPPFSPKQITCAKNQQLEELLELFASRGMAQQYHIAKMLSSPLPRLFRLPAILQYGAKCPPATPPEDGSTAQIDQSEGLWGYRIGEQWLVAPLFESAFEPTDGVMLVGLGRYKHFISLDSRILATFDEQTSVKPFRNGQTTIRHSDGTTSILYCEDILHNSTK